MQGQQRNVQIRVMRVETYCYFEVLVTVAVVVAKSSLNTFGGKLVKPVRRWLKSGIFYLTIG